MELWAISRPLLILARLSGLVAATLTFGTYMVLVFFSPNEGVGNCCDETEGIPVLVANFVFALSALWGVFKVRPSLLLLAFLGSFAFAGWYALIFENWFRWDGIGSILYLVATALMALDVLLASPRREPV